MCRALRHHHRQQRRARSIRLQQRFNFAARFCSLFHLVAAQPVMLPVSATGGGRTPVLCAPKASLPEGGGFWRQRRQKTEGVITTPKSAQILLPTSHSLGHLPLRGSREAAKNPSRRARHRHFSLFIIHYSLKKSPSHEGDFLIHLIRRGRLF